MHIAHKRSEMILVRFQMLFIDIFSCSSAGGSIGLLNRGSRVQAPLGELKYRVCGVMVAHDIWDVGEAFESHIFY